MSDPAPRAVFTRRRRLLVVDDAADVRELAAMSLEALHGWEILQAPSGAEGVRLALAESLDAVLLDVQMPEQDGPATLEELRRHPGTVHVPVVFLTARNMPAEMRALEDLGVAGVLGKPFDPMRLGEQLSALMGWS